MKEVAGWSLVSAYFSAQLISLLPRPLSNFQLWVGGSRSGAELPLAWLIGGSLVLVSLLTSVAALQLNRYAHRLETEAVEHL